MRFVRTGTFTLRAAAALALGFANQFVLSAIKVGDPDRLVELPRGHMIGRGRRTAISPSLRDRSRYTPHFGAKQQRKAARRVDFQFPEHLAWQARRDAKELCA